MKHITALSQGKIFFLFILRSRTEVSSMTNFFGHVLRREKLEHLVIIGTRKEKCRRAKWKKDVG